MIHDRVKFSHTCVAMYAVDADIMLIIPCRCTVTIHTLFLPSSYLCTLFPMTTPLVTHSSHTHILYSHDHSTYDSFLSYSCTLFLMTTPLLTHCSHSYSTMTHCSHITPLSQDSVTVQLSKVEICELRPKYLVEVMKN